jgi:hypothetical protein
LVRKPREFFSAKHSKERKKKMKRWSTAIQDHHHLQLGNETEGVQSTPSTLTANKGSKDMKKLDTQLSQYLQLGTKPREFNLCKKFIKKEYQNE